MLQVNAGPFKRFVKYQRGVPQLFFRGTALSAEFTGRQILRDEFGNKTTGFYGYITRYRKLVSFEFKVKWGNFHADEVKKFNEAMRQTRHRNYVVVPYGCAMNTPEGREGMIAEMPPNIGPIGDWDDKYRGIYIDYFNIKHHDNYRLFWLYRSYHLPSRIISSDTIETNFFLGDWYHFQKYTRFDTGDITIQDDYWENQALANDSLHGITYWLLNSERRFHAIPHVESHEK